MKKLIVIALFLLSFSFYGVALAYTVNQGDTLSGIGAKLGLSWRELWELNPQVKNPNVIFVGQALITTEKAVGATLPVAGTTYNLAGSGITASATSITLQTLTIPQTGYLLQDSDFSTTFYITLEPGSKARQEVVACTTITQNANGSATLSGCSRGMLPFNPFTASTTYQFSHAGGTTVIFSDPPQLFNEYISKTNNEYVTGTITFVTSPVIPTPTSADLTYAANVQYVNSASNQGAATSTEVNLGLVEIATRTEVASSTASSSAGGPLVIPSKWATSTPTTGLYIPVTQNNGKLHGNWTDETYGHTWTASTSFSASTTFSGASTTINNLVVNGRNTKLNNLNYKLPTAHNSASSTLINDSFGNLAWGFESWREVICTSTAITTTTLEVRNLTLGKDISILLNLLSPSGGQAEVTFNSDPASNYGYRAYENFVLAAQASNALFVALSNSSTTQQYYDIRIGNQASVIKPINWQGSSTAGKPSNVIINGTGVWNDSTNLITGVRIRMTPAETFVAGSRMCVYSSRD